MPGSSLVYCRNLNRNSSAFQRIFSSLSTAFTQHHTFELNGSDLISHCSRIEAPAME